MAARNTSVTSAGHPFIVARPMRHHVEVSRWLRLLHYHYRLWGLPPTSSNSSTTDLNSGESSVESTSTAPTEVGEFAEGSKSLEILLSVRLEEDYFHNGNDEKKV